VKRSVHERLSLLGLTALVGWLLWMAPVTWTACAAMSVRMPMTECVSQPDCGTPFQHMTEGCLLQLGCFTNYLAIQPVSVQVPAPLAPPALLETRLRKPPVSLLTPFIDVFPPPRPRPIRLYYGVFLK